MLVLSRKVGEVIVIGEDVRVTVLEIRGDKARLGVTAPRSVNVRREELLSPEEQEASRATESREATSTIHPDPEDDLRW